MNWRADEIDEYVGDGKKAYSGRTSRGENISGKILEEEERFCKTEVNPIKESKYLDKSDLRINLEGIKSESRNRKTVHVSPLNQFYKKYAEEE